MKHSDKVKELKQMNTILNSKSMYIKISNGDGKLFQREDKK